ncbi:MAG TPA: ATP-binding cassette domain-containing protein, partial [Alphaproteobacteria bacterium]|nr:ATP-binding cassette domain-containing protein [Alphaproteobacteria bacterium]
MAEPATPKLRIAGLKKAFGGERVLDGIDLQVPAGENLVLLGASGSGKTLTLKCILGLVRPDAGRIELDGQDIVPLSGRERDRLLSRFGMLFQQAALFDSLPVWRNVAFRLLQQKTDRDEARRIADETLKAVGLTPETGDLLPAELSGGMQKRVGIARAIAGRPEVLLLDEPTA